MDFFKPEDSPLGPNQLMSFSERAAHSANSKLNQALGPVVYSHTRQGWYVDDPDHMKFQARLFNIQPIEKECQHTIAVPHKTGVPIVASCIQCGKKLRLKYEVAE